MASHNSPKPRPTEQDWMARWQRVARRIRVPLGFLTAALYLYELWRRAPLPAAVAWSLALVLPGLWLRAYASGYVKKNRELTVTGPYAHTRNPLYLGSMLIAAGFALALLSWPVALVLASGFAVIYVPVIASEERFLRATFPAFDAYCRRVPRLIPRLIPAYQAGARTRRRRLLLCALLQAPRVQCCYRGRTAVPQPALPAAGCGCNRAWAAVSVTRPRESNSKEPCLTVKTRTAVATVSLRPCPGRRGSRPADGPAHAAARGLQLSAEADPHLFRGLASLSRRNGGAAL